MSTIRPASSTHGLPQSVLILCADDGLAEELVRELAARRYQPLVGRPGWSLKAALEWARPAVAVVHVAHPAALADGFLPDSAELGVGLVVFGEPAPGAAARPGVRAIVPNANARLIGGAVDDALRERSA
jgi:hypothetical protein